MKFNPSLRQSYSSKESKIWIICSGYETFYSEQNYSIESIESLVMMCIFVKPQAVPSSEKDSFSQFFIDMLLKG